MKKILALFLTLALCLSFAACQSGEDAAEVPAESTDSAAANESTGETEPEVDVNAPYYGTWVNLYDNTAMTLEPQGKATLDGADYTYAVADGIVTLSAPDAEITLDITDHNGISRLVNRAVSMDFVPEAEIDAFAPVTVELTMDNWEEYFVLCEEPSFGYVDLPCPETGVPDFEVRLKEEYIPRLLDTPTNDNMELNVVFVFGYDAAAYEFKLSGEEYTFQFLDTVPSQYVSMIPEPRECILRDYRSWGMVDPIWAWGGWYASWMGPSSGTVLYPINPYVTDVHGTITLLP